MGYLQRVNEARAQKGVDRCVLILQRDGKIRVEGNREILHTMIEAYATVVREKKTSTPPAAGDEVEKT